MISNGNIVPENVSPIEVGSSHDDSDQRKFEDDHSFNRKRKRIGAKTRGRGRGKGGTKHRNRRPTVGNSGEDTQSLS